jgi:hypothetical protein
MFLKECATEGQIGIAEAIYNYFSQLKNSASIGIDFTGKLYSCKDSIAQSIQCLLQPASPKSQGAKSAEQLACGIVPYLPVR